ncbi:MAG: endolytic transglycosylase MltG [Muribaculaceae bacterium]|nr:endolytic transglycosylase MltG [Muribaculaceae bacterium]
MSSPADDTVNKDVNVNSENTDNANPDNTSADTVSADNEALSRESDNTVASNSYDENQSDVSEVVNDENGNIPLNDENISVNDKNIPVNDENIPKVKKKHTALWITLVAVFAIIAAGLIFTIPILTSKAPEQAVIKIPKDATSQNVADTLTKYLGKPFADKVMRVASLRNSDFSKRHGAYLIEEGLSPLRVERKLAHGTQYPLTLTINGFRTLPTLTERVARRFDFTSDSLKAALTDKETLSRYGLTPNQAIALFIDDSYELYWSASPNQVISKLGDNYDKVWNKERRAKAAALGLTPAQVMTLCSIVDEESNKLDDKGKIGRLYINRIKAGMPLQADPTIRYALNDFTIRRVKGSHLKVASPYNTYLNNGLPPGPIRTTSVATIDAVLNSEPSSHLYMCAKEDFSGYHNFASTYPEHLANARRYQKALDARGIK